MPCFPIDEVQPSMLQSAQSRPHFTFASPSPTPLSHPCTCTILTSPATLANFLPKLATCTSTKSFQHNCTESTTTNSQFDNTQLDHACATTSRPHHKCAQQTPTRTMAPTQSCQKREALSAMRNVTLVLKKETAKKEFLHDTLMMTYTHLMKTAAKLGDLERAHKRAKRKAREKKLTKSGLCINSRMFDHARVMHSSQWQGHQAPCLGCLIHPC